MSEATAEGPPQPPAPWESGWKDVVRVDGGTVTRVVVRFPTADELGFDPDASFPRPNPSPDLASHSDAHAAHRDSDLRGYIWHCHLLDHEDHDMMLRFRTVR